jgi:hypothetical protein
VITLAVDRADLGPDLLVWLRNFVKQQDATAEDHPNA